MSAVSETLSSVYINQFQLAILTENYLHLFDSCDPLTLWNKKNIMELTDKFKQILCEEY